MTEVFHLKADRSEISLCYVKLNFKMILFETFFEILDILRIIRCYTQKFDFLDQYSKHWIWRGINIFTFIFGQNLLYVSKNKPKLANLTISLLFSRDLEFSPFSPFFPIFIVLCPLKKFLWQIWKKIELAFIGNVFLFNLSYHL